MAVTVLEPAVLAKLDDFRARMAWYTHNKPEVQSVVEHCHVPGHRDRQLLSIVHPEKLRRMLTLMLDEEEFLSPHGLRSVSRYHADHPFVLSFPGGRVARVDYEPAESRTGLFGGNSNWRGPVWFPLNHLVVQGLRRFHAYLGDDFTVECPVGSGSQLHLGAVADEICRRLVAIFATPAAGGPSSGATSCSSATPPGTTCCPSTSTSTATTARGSGPPTRPAGPDWSATCWRRGKAGAGGGGEEGERVSRRALALFAVMCVIWGIPYLFIKVAVSGMTPATWSSCGPRSGQSCSSRWRSPGARCGRCSPPGGG